MVGNVVTTMYVKGTAIAASVTHRVQRESGVASVQRRVVMAIVPNTAATTVPGPITNADSHQSGWSPGMRRAHWNEGGVSSVGSVDVSRRSAR